MLTIRIIPCLDVDKGRVVKGIRFRDLKIAGDPVELAKYYNDSGADELVFLDVTASVEGRKTMARIVEKVARNVFIPFCVGGGIRTIEDMRNLLNAGADKVAICTAALENPGLIEEGASLFGSQCIVVSIDAKRVKNTWHCFTHGGRFDSGVDVVNWAKKCEKLGAGEILLNSIDKDGTQTGYDIELNLRVSSIVRIPVIASGGAGNLEQIYRVIKHGRADAVLLASVLHYKKFTIERIKKYLKKMGVCVRW
ncbi:MAG: imidazole glycerol phosphate synthase subunit HisF [candidate division WOR-3 bacterium]|nr:imidazole glycerol phosphate synthase subunit HisF [candidate division WOR-3 bacterium]